MLHHVLGDNLNIFHSVPPIYCSTCSLSKCLVAEVLTDAAIIHFLPRALDEPVKSFAQAPNFRLLTLSVKRERHSSPPFSRLHGWGQGYSLGLQRTCDCFLPSAHLNANPVSLLPKIDSKALSETISSAIPFSLRERILLRRSCSYSGLMMIIDRNRILCGIYQEWRSWVKES